MDVCSSQTEGIVSEKKPEQNLMSKVLSRCKSDTAFCAALKRADNPDTEYQSWEYLADYGVNLEYEVQRLPFTTVFAAAARSSNSTDGFMTLGQALLVAYDGDRDSAPARSRLRRILACDTTEEVCDVLHSMLRLIESKGVSISYGLLLRDLKYFDKNPEQTKARWAQEFFGKKTDDTEEDNS